MLQPVDAQSGHFQIDERNGIVLDAYFVKDTLYSRFEVAGNLIEVHYTLRDGGIEVLLTTFPAKALKETGGEGRIPVVKAYELRHVQRGRLERR